MLRRYLVHFLINRNFGLFMSGALFSATGSWFLAVAIGWLVWDIGRSEFLLGLANFAQMGPLLLFGAIGGAIADRVERRRLLIGSQAFSAAASFALAAIAWLGLATVPTVLALLLAIGITQVFAWPAWSPFIADLVGPARLRQAVAFNSVRFNLTRIVGPALAGLLIASAGAAACVALAALSQISLLVTLALIRVPAQPRAKAEPLLAAVREGIRVAWRTPSVRETLSIAALVGAVVLPYTVFLPAYAEQVLHFGPEGLGLLYTTVGLGAVGAAAISSSRLVARRPRRAVIFFTLLSGLSLAAFGFSTAVVPSLLSLFFLGFGTLGFLTTANANVQLAVPREMVGRVIGIWTVLNAGMTPLGGIVLGWLAERGGLGITLAGAGILCTAVCAAIGWLPTRSATAPQTVTTPDEQTGG
ncbi:MAG: MFS transporter [Chloroflexota bacterium]